MPTIAKPALPRRKPTIPTSGGGSAPARMFVVHFSFNNTVDPAWRPALDSEPASRRERRLARTAAASERARLGGTTD